MGVNLVGILQVGGFKDEVGKTCQDGQVGRPSTELTAINKAFAGEKNIPYAKLRAPV